MIFYIFVYLSVLLCVVFMLVIAFQCFSMLVQYLCHAFHWLFNAGSMLSNACSMLFKFVHALSICFSADSMLVNALSMLSNVFFEFSCYAFQWCVVASQCFSMLFNHLLLPCHCISISFQCFFNAFPMPFNAFPCIFKWFWSFL